MRTNAHTPTPTVPDAAIEALLAEITSAAFSTERLPGNVVGHTADLLEQEINTLRSTIARMGWMADIALRRINNEKCVRNGEAEAWLLPRAVYESLAQEVQP